MMFLFGFFFFSSLFGPNRGLNVVPASKKKFGSIRTQIQRKYARDSQHHKKRNSNGGINRNKITHCIAWTQRQDASFSNEDAAKEQRKIPSGCTTKLKIGGVFFSLFHFIIVLELTQIAQHWASDRYFSSIFCSASHSKENFLTEQLQ